MDPLTLVDVVAIQSGLINWIVEVKFDHILIGDLRVVQSELVSHFVLIPIFVLYDYCASFHISNDMRFMRRSHIKDRSLRCSRPVE